MTGAFTRVVHAELTKLLTVPRWLLGLAAMSLLTVGFGVASSRGSGTDANEHVIVGPGGIAVVDDLYFVHRTVTGDATITTRVIDQDPSHPLAQAGLLLKQGITSGSRYASVAVTPRHGVQFDADFSGDPVEAAATAPRWLRLTRRGSEVSGYASADGNDWQLIGSADLAGLDPTVEVGLFVSSPSEVVVERDAGSTAVGQTPTVGRAMFSDLSLEPSPPASDGPIDANDANDDADDAGGGWHGDAVVRPDPLKPGDPAVGVPDAGGPVAAGGVTEAGGRYTITGSGDIGPTEPPDDSVQIGLFGAVFGLLALAAVAVLFVTSEHKRHMVWTTFAATPHRRQALGAKAVVVGSIAFGLGLATATVSYLVTRPILRTRGYTRPAFAPTSLTQPGVVRALVGTALLLAAFAVLGLALGSLLRRSSGAIAAVFTLGIVPLFAALIVPAASTWLLWLTPAGGFAVQRAKPPTDELAEPWSQMNPWAGLAVAAAYAVVALAIAIWAVDRRDA